MHTPRSLLMFVLAACGSLLLLPSMAAADTDQPNIVLIMADDLGYECVSPGASDYDTPNLDALAASGMRFDNAFSNPICTPSRVKIMTGMYNVRNYVGFGKLEKHQRTFAHQLKQAGYATAIAGKWQLEGGRDAPQHFGFDQSCLWQQITSGRVRQEGNRIDKRYENPMLEFNGRDRSYKKKTYHDGQYAPDICTNFLTDFMEQSVEDDQPFLAYYPMIIPHWPFTATPDSADWDPTSPGAKKRRGPGNSAERKQHFQDMVTYTGKLVGRIAAKLEALGVRDNTLIIFVGDNGTDFTIRSTWNGRSIKGGKGQVNDRGMRVPFIASWPGIIPADTTTDRLVEFSDILPTLCDAADAPLPEGRATDGVTLLPTLKGNEKAAPDKRWIYTWHRGKAMARTKTYMVRRKVGTAGGTLFHYTARYQKSRISTQKLTDKQKAIKAKLVKVLDRLASQRKSEVGPVKSP
jgi:arylsulfatase A